MIRILSPDACRWILRVLVIPILLRLPVAGAEGAIDPSVTPPGIVLPRSGTGWQLTIQGRPFWIQGVGCNTANGPKGENFLRMAHDMGANAVRTWGDAPRSYLEAAQRAGLKVDLGVWFNPIRAGMTESYLDPDYRQKEKARTLAYVRQMKGQPALLFWNLGNEVFTFTEKPEEQEAFGHFLEDLIQAVHREDPLHPVVFAAAGEADFVALKAFVPSLDILGINSYGGLSGTIHRARTLGLDQPIVVTEFGALGSWDQAKDRNNEPYDPFDQMKVGNFVSLWKQIVGERPQTLGGFAFVLGNPRNQDSLTWFNINFGDNKRDSYWALYELYTGKTAPKNRPKVGQMTIDPSGPVKPGESVNVHVTMAASSMGKLQWNYLISDISSDPVIVKTAVLFDPKTRESGPGEATLTAPERPGAYRLYAIVSDLQKNAAIADRSLVVAP